MSPAPIVFFLPARNEAPTVAAVLGRMPAVVCGHPVRRMVVDDGSSDATAALAAGAGAHILSLADHQGLGAAVRRGLSQALAFDPVAVVFCDADGEYAPEELERLLAPILGGEADYVVGTRFGNGPRAMRWHRQVGNRLLTAGLRVTARHPISDGQSGYRALSARAAVAAEVAHDYNYAQVLTLDLLAKGFRYAEVPISYQFRTEGRSFIRLVPYLRRVLPLMWRMRLSRAQSVLPWGLRPHTPSRPGSLARAQSVLPWGLRPHTPSRPGSLARAQSSTTWARKASRADTHVAESKLPS